MGIHHRPFKRLHAPHRSAHHRVPPFDAQVIGQIRLGADHVANGHPGEPRTVGAGRAGLRVRRSGGALTAAQHVGAHHEVMVGIDCGARTNHVVPPAGCGMGRASPPGSMAVTGQRVWHQHGIGGRRVQLSPRLVGHHHLRQPAACLQLKAAASPHRCKLAAPRRIARHPGAAHRNRAGGRRNGCWFGGLGAHGRSGGYGERRRKGPGIGPLVVPADHIPTGWWDGTLGVRPRLPDPAPPDRSECCCEAPTIAQLRRRPPARSQRRWVTAPFRA